MARDTGILQDRDSRGELRLDLRVTAEKWWTGGELNSRHRDFQSRAFACRGADFRTWSPKRGPSGFTCWSRHPQSLGLSAPGCGKSRPWKRPAAHAESSLRVYTPKRLGRVSALSRLKHGSRLVGDWLKSDQSGRGPRLSPLCRPAADPRRGDGAPRRAPAPRGARGSPPEPPPGRPAPAPSVRRLEGRRPGPSAPIQDTPCPRTRLAGPLATRYRSGVPLEASSTPRAGGRGAAEETQTRA
jgi:hypothetical protein